MTLLRCLPDEVIAILGRKRILAECGRHFLSQNKIQQSHMLKPLSPRNHIRNHTHDPVVSVVSASCSSSTPPLTNSFTILRATIHNQCDKKRQERQSSSPRQTAHKPRCRPEGINPVFMAQRNRPRNDRSRRANKQKRCPNLHHNDDIISKNPLFCGHGVTALPLRFSDVQREGRSYCVRTVTEVTCVAGMGSPLILTPPQV